MITTHGLGDALRDSGLLTADELARADAVATERGLPLEHAVVALGLLAEDQVLWLAADLTGVDLVFPTEDAVDADLVAKFPAAELRAASALPLVREEDGTVVVAFAEPPPPSVVRRLSEVCGAPVRAVLASGPRLRRVLGRIAGSGREDPARAAAGDPSGVTAFYRHLTAALADGGTELRLEPSAAGVRVRYRRDGALVDAGREPLTIAPALAARARMVAGLQAAPVSEVQARSLHVAIGRRRRRLSIVIAKAAAGDVVVVRALPDVRLPDALSEWPADDDMCDVLRRFDRPGTGRGTLRVACADDEVRVAFARALSAAADAAGAAVVASGADAPAGPWIVAAPSAVSALAPDLLLVTDRDTWDHMAAEDAFARVPRVVVAARRLPRIDRSSPCPQPVTDLVVDTDVADGEVPRLVLAPTHEGSV